MRRRETEAYKHTEERRRGGGGVSTLSTGFNHRLTKLLIFYINDICKVTNLLKFVIFAYDTNIFCTGDDLQHVLKIVTKEMNNLKLWFDSNELSLSLNKTKFMFFGKHKIKMDVKIVIDVKIECMKTSFRELS